MKRRMVMEYRSLHLEKETLSEECLIDFQPVV